MVPYPLNRHVLVSRCEDPRTHAPIALPNDGQYPETAFGVVDQLDPERDGSVPLSVEVGDIIYFPAQVGTRIIADLDQVKFLVHEQQILARVRGVKVKRLDATPEQASKVQRVPASALQNVG